MAKLNSRLTAKRPLPPWKQLHHWQGLGLVLLMFPLGFSFILGSAALEQANRQGLPEEGWAEELADNLGNKLSGNSIAKAMQWTGQSIMQWQPQPSQVAEGLDSDKAPQPIVLRRRQRRAIKHEIADLSGQTHQRLAEAIETRANQAIQPSPADIKPAPAFSAASTNLATAPVLQHHLTPDLRHRSTPASAPTTVGKLQHSPEEVANFLAIALGTEFSPNSQPSSIPHIRKWTQDLRIQVYGHPTPTDIATLEQVVAEINHLLGDVELGFVESEPNLEIFFVAEQNFSQYEASYKPVNHGFFWNEAAQGEIQRGRILISTTDINQPERSHLIREELTQSLGLMQDSAADSNSIFFQGWSQTQAYSKQDKQLLTMLYRPDIQPGMDAVAVQRVLLGS